MKARNMTFCTLAGGDSGTLGIKTENGILDVAKASQLFRIKAPAESGCRSPARGGDS